MEFIFVEDINDSRIGSFRDRIQTYGGLITTKQEPAIITCLLEQAKTLVVKMAKALHVLLEDDAEFNSNTNAIYYGIVDNISINALLLPASQEQDSEYFIALYLGLLICPYSVLINAMSRNSQLLNYVKKDHFIPIERASCVLLPNSILRPKTKASVTRQITAIHEKGNLGEYSIKFALEIAQAITSFSFIHELAHAVRSHVKIRDSSGNYLTANVLDEKNCLKAFSITNQQDSKGNKIVLRALEHDADEQAIAALLRIYDKISGVMTGHVDISLDSTKNILLDTLFGETFALGILFILMDNDEEIDSQQADHPPSYYRFQHLQYLLEKYGNNIWELSKNECQEEILNAMLELQNFARILGRNASHWASSEESETSKVLQEYREHVSKELPEYSSTIRDIERLTSSSLVFV